MAAHVVRSVLAMTVAAALSCASSTSLVDDPDAGDARPEDTGAEVEADAGEADGTDSSDVAEATDADCPDGTIPCGGRCVDPSTDSEHCGSCGTACPEGENADPRCELGECGLRCRPGWSDRDGVPGCEYECVPTGAAEACNGNDDDCDGETDEGFPCRVGARTACTTPCGSAGIGLCSLACEVPPPASCTPPAEICNGADDDCDGDCDDGFECCRGAVAGCTTTGGAPGARTCSAACGWGPCVATGEACNGTDDDGDGLCDEDFACCAGTSGSCTAACGTAGTRVCSAACVWNPCIPPAETCNGRDDDCDGETDEGFACAAGTSGPCTTLCGSAGTRTCLASCTWNACVPPGEVCNGRDDDCDTLTDEGFGCVAGAVAGCTTGCGSLGSRTCASDCTWPACVPPAETCNGVDDDCDGECDEGCRHGIHRGYSSVNDDHFYTPNRADVECCSYTVEAYDFFFLYASAIAGTVPFHRCWLEGSRDHFYTTAADCEGAGDAVYEGVIGHIGTSAFCGGTPLYRLAGTGDHFYTISAPERDAAVAGGWLDEGIAGYVWTP